MVTINKFCFCMSLDVGTILMGWLGVVLYMTTLIASFKILMSGNLTLFALFGVGFMFTASIVHLCDSIALIFGTIKRIHNLLLPWLFGQLLVVLCMIGFQFYILLLYQKTERIVCMFVLLMMWTVLQMYFWLCSYSMYERIKLSREIERQSTKIIDDI